MIKNTIDVIKTEEHQGIIIYRLTAEVLECNNQTLTVRGIPEDFSTWQVRYWYIPGSDISVTDYMGTYELGLLYLSKPVNIEIGKVINLVY